MPNRLIPLLSYACAALLAAYLLLVAAAVSFAAWRTELARSLAETETVVAALESKYYAAINDLSKTDPAAVGLVTPRSVGYVTEQGTAVVSFNNETSI